jgi:hypothetical protein
VLSDFHHDLQHVLEEPIDRENETAIESLILFDNLVSDIAPIVSSPFAEEMWENTGVLGSGVDGLQATTNYGGGAGTFCSLLGSHNNTEEKKPIYVGRISS